MSKPKTLWFKRRRYGWGWTPVTWQGWLTVVGLLVVVFGGAIAVGNASEGGFQAEVGLYLLVVVLAVAALIRISIAKGPAPKWRWGKKSGDNPDEDW